MKYEDGFHFNEYPCASGKPDALIIFLHGHGNHPDMFTQLPDEIHKQCPNADILIVRGPVGIGADKARIDRHGVPGADDLYTWYKASGKPEESLELAISHLFNRVPVIDQLNKFADEQLKKRGLEDDGLLLFGFSLGGAVVVQMGTRRDKQCAGIICHSGPVLPIMHPKSKPDTLLVMGDEDRLFYKNSRIIENPNPPPKRGKIGKAFDKALDRISIHYNASLMRLKKIGMLSKGVVVSGMSHTINEESFGHSIKFIVDHLKKPDAPAPPASPLVPPSP